jgi:hypothetical protein
VKITALGVKSVEPAEPAIEIYFKSYCNLKE